MHRFYVTDDNIPWARDLVRRINLEAVRLDLALDARLGHAEGIVEEAFPYSAYIEVERTDTGEMLSPGEHFEGFPLLAERLEEASEATIEALIEAAGLHHDPQPTRSLVN
jgi:hypothetical protein